MADPGARPLTAAQTNAARQFALAYGATVETESGSLGPGEIADGATALGIVIALGVLAMSVGLIRSEAARTCARSPRPAPGARPGG